MFEQQMIKEVFLTGLFGYSAIDNFKMNCALLIAFNTN